MGLRDNLELMLQRGQDSPLLRFSLGSACLDDGDLLAAITHLSAAVEQNPRYSAAWRRLGDACVRAGSVDRAAEVYGRGIAVATAAGDLQAAREMTVFLRRIRRGREDAAS